MSTFVSYAIILVSFDADYYSGTFVRKDEQGRRHHISNVKVDLDDGIADVMLGKKVNDSELLTDFESDNVIEVEHEIGKLLTEKAHDIFQAVKERGEIYELTMLD